MLERYRKELEAVDITNLDELNEDGTFSKEIINDNEKYEPGYVGVISINSEDKPEIIFVRYGLNGRRLICVNFRGTFIQSELSLLENRDPITLFDEYCKDANVFIDIQSLNRYKYYMLYKTTGIDDEAKAELASDIDNQIAGLEQKLEASKKM